MIWVTSAAVVEVEDGVVEKTYVASCGSGLSLGGIKWIPWVVHMDG